MDEKYGNTSALSEVSQFQFRLGLGKTIAMKSAGQALQVQLSGGYRLPVSNEFAFNSINESYFVNNIIEQALLPD